LLIRDREETKILTTTPQVEEYWTALERALQESSADEQRAAVVLYRELARGEAVTPEHFGRALNVSQADAEALLGRPSIRSFTYRDAQDQLVGFGGLSTVPMHHTLRVTGRTLWTWCAWDSLFIPEILGLRAEVESLDPETRRPVRLIVTPDQVENVDSEGTVVSFVMPDALGQSAATVIGSFCHFIFFFESRDSGERWVTKHAGTFLYPLNVAFDLARRWNRARFGAMLTTEVITQLRDPILRS
jgi:alkylmercury lyase